MATQVAAAKAETKTQGTTATKRDRHSWATHFDGGKDERLEVRLEHRRDGTWKTLVKHVAGSGKNKKTARGGTEMHTDEKAACAAYDKAVTTAEKAGWRRHEGRGGFAARPDAFTLATLPKPATNKK